jgi:hypothetical protein
MMEIEARKRSEAAPAGPPHDLVRGRGQKPAETSGGNRTTSHAYSIAKNTLPNKGDTVRDRCPFSAGGIRQVC